MSQNFRKRKKRIVFFGDSLTKQGSLAGGYIKLLTRYLEDDDLSEQYQIIGSGIGGNKVIDLDNRVEEDVLSSGADIVVIFIGINDVWHKLHNDGTDEVTFKSTYKALIERLQGAGIRVMLCTPTVIGEKTDDTNPQDMDLKFYVDMVRTIAGHYELPLVDLHKAFFEYNHIHNVSNETQGILTTDTVHLNDRGNQLVAEQVWKVLRPLLTE